MKTTIKILSLLLALIFVMPILTGCEAVTDFLGSFIIIDDGTPDVQEGGKYYVTIQWVQGQKVLKEETVEKGTTLTEWTPAVEGMEFQGWYERPYIKKFDFSKPVTKSMIIYASFKSDDAVIEPGDEMPDWYLIGAGKGDLNKCNNWQHEAAAANLGLKAGEDGIYRVTLSLYAGDQFKMTNNLGWDNEKAIDKMAGFADGAVKDAEGNVVFIAGENNNFVLAEGRDGKYEISYDANLDVISFKFIEALESLPDDIRLIGDFNNWNTSYGEGDYKFTSNDGVNWTYTWEVVGSATFKLYNNLSGVYYPGGMGNDLVISEGTYTVHFNSNTREIVVKDSNGNTVDVGGGNEGGGDNGGGTTVTPNANPVEKVYVVLNSTWNDGSKMGAWTWVDGGAEQWADFVATETEGVYEVSIPAGANMVIFVDFNEGTTEYNWDMKREQTSDLAVPDKSDDKIYYHVSNGTWSNSSENSGEGSGSTGNGPALTETVTVYFENNWLWTNVACYYWGGEGFVATEWPGAPMTKVGTLDGHDVYSIELPVGVIGFLFTGNKDTEPHDLDQSPDISTEGISNGSAWKMDWADGNIVTAITYDPNAEENPENPENPVVPSDGKTLYLVPNKNWLEGGARFAVYYWDGNGSDGWVSMTLVEGTLYTATVPAGNPNIIFCRMNPSVTENGWSNKWNQTADLMLPTDGTNCYTVAEGAWDKGSGSWSTHEAGSCVHTPAGDPTVITAPTCTTEGQGSYVCSKCSETYTASIPATGHSYENGTCTSCGIGSVYSVVGSIPGLSWEPADTAGDMTYDAETGIYTKVFTNVAAGKYEYKVCLNHEWNDGQYPTGMVNETVTVDAAGSTVTVTWNPSTQTLEATVS